MDELSHPQAPSCVDKVEVESSPSSHSPHVTATETQTAPVQTEEILSPRPQLTVTAEKSSEEAPPRQDGHEPDVADKVHGKDSCSQSTCDSKDAANGTTPRLSFVSALSEQYDVARDSNQSVFHTAVPIEEETNADPVRLLQEDTRTATQLADLEVSCGESRNRDLLKLSPRRARLTNIIRGTSDMSIVAARVNLLDSKEITSSRLQRQRHTTSCPQLPSTGLGDERDLFSTYVHSYLGVNPALDLREGFEESSISNASVANDGTSTLPDLCGDGCTVGTSCGHHTGSSTSSAPAPLHHLASTCQMTLYHLGHP